eukprot:359284-Chlamydomonas_euryale.AAC.4
MGPHTTAPTVRISKWATHTRAVHPLGKMYQTRPRRPHGQWSYLASSAVECAGPIFRPLPLPEPQLLTRPSSAPRPSPPPSIHSPPVLRHHLCQ